MEAPPLLSTLRESLEKVKPVKSLPRDKKACVALLLREIPSGNLQKDARRQSSSLDSLSDCEMFFILRAENENDRWSGHVGFPGGRQEEGETDIETCKREVLEEVGIDLNSRDFVLLGFLNDRVVMQKLHRLVVILY